MSPLEWFTLALVVMNFALVVITSYYAWQTQQVVHEMRAARIASETPHLALTVESSSTGDSGSPVFGIKNRGPGAAVQVTLQLGCDPEGVRWSWSMPFIEPGQRLVSMPQELMGKNMSSYHKDSIVWAKGSCRSTSGTTHQINESLRFSDVVVTAARTATQNRQRI